MTSWISKILKTSEHLIHSNIFFCSLFHSNAFESFDTASATLTISNSSDFEWRETYKMEAMLVVLEGDISEITNSTFPQWSSRVSVVIGDSVTSIGLSAFYSW